MNVIPIRRGYWGKKAGAPHTVANKLMGKCGSVRVRLIPAPRGTGLVAAPASKKLLSMAGLEDCYTSSRGHTRTMGNFIKATSTGKAAKALVARESTMDGLTVANTPATVDVAQ